MRIALLAFAGVLLSFGAYAFAPNMPAMWQPFPLGAARCTPLVYDLGGGTTDLGNFSRVFVASGC